MDQRALARKNLDKRLAPLRDMALIPPARGWVHAIRQALGMTTAQLGRRLNVSQPRIIALEKAETGDSVTLKSLREAAEAMDCSLVYALVPRRSLDDTLRARARNCADAQLQRTSHSMRLENQGLTSDDLATERERLIAELMAGSPRHLWETP